MIFEFMKKHATGFTIEKMALVFGVSRAGYYKYISKKETYRSMRNKQLLDNIRAVYQQNRGVYGSPRIYRVLKNRGENCSRKIVARLMKVNKIQDFVKSEKSLDFN